jgi:hypothetical protein
MVGRNRIAATLAAAVALGLTGCGGGGGTPTPPPAAPPRCNGQAATSSTQTWSVAVRDNPSGCILRVDTMIADSETEASACEQTTLNQQGLNASPVTSGTLQNFFFAFYLSGSCISTIQIVNTSAASAMTCAQTSCSNCQVVDITSSVVGADGSIDSNALSDWCANHPTP